MIAVNVLWSFSLLCCLGSAHIVITMQNSIRRYQSLQERYSQTLDNARDLARIRAYYRQGLKNWKFDRTLYSVHMLTEAGIYLFVIGLLIYLIGFDRIVFIVTLVIAGLWAIFHVVISFCGALISNCPYYSALGAPLVLFSASAVFATGEAVKFAFQFLWFAITLVLFPLFLLVMGLVFSFNYLFCHEKEDSSRSSEKDDKEMRASSNADQIKELFQEQLPVFNGKDFTSDPLNQVLRDSAAESMDAIILSDDLHFLLRERKYLSAYFDSVLSHFRSPGVQISAESAIRLLENDKFMGALTYAIGSCASKPTKDVECLSESDQIHQSLTGTRLLCHLVSTIRESNPNYRWRKVLGLVTSPSPLERLIYGARYERNAPNVRIAAYCAQIYIIHTIQQSKQSFDSSSSPSGYVFQGHRLGIEFESGYNKFSRVLFREPHVSHETLLELVNCPGHLKGMLETRKALRRNLYLLYTTQFVRTVWEQMQSTTSLDEEIAGIFTSVLKEITSEWWLLYISADQPVRKYFMDLWDALQDDQAGAPPTGAQNKPIYSADMTKWTHRPETQPVGVGYAESRRGQGSRSMPAVATLRSSSAITSQIIGLLRPLYAQIRYE
jgi:hypothetical protein